MVDVVMTRMDDGIAMHIDEVFKTCLDDDIKTSINDVVVKPSGVSIIMSSRAWLSMSILSISNHI